MSYLSILYIGNYLNYIFGLYISFVITFVLDILPDTSLSARHENVIKGNVRNQTSARENQMNKRTFKEPRKYHQLCLLRSFQSGKTSASSGEETADVYWEAGRFNLASRVRFPFFLSFCLFFFSLLTSFDFFTPLFLHSAVLLINFYFGSET